MRSAQDSLTLIFMLALSLLWVFEASAQTPRCLSTDFSGEASQTQPFIQKLGGGITFSVNPMQLREDPNQAWFQIRVIGDGPGYAFQFSDENWLLAASGFSTAFIGCIQCDVRAALGYRSRHFLIPLSVKNMEKAREASRLVYHARTPEQKRNAISALNLVRLAQADFEITDFALGPGEPPVSVEWVKFKVTLALPLDFMIWGQLPVSEADCPAIPAETIANIRDPHRHEYPLRREEQSFPQQ